VFDSNNWGEDPVPLNQAVELSQTSHGSVNPAS
jgi:hypothetical protein